MQSHITVAYLVTDESFVASCLQQDPKAVIYWQQKVAANPDLQPVIAEATQLIAAMYHHGLNKEIAAGQQTLLRMMQETASPLPAITTHRRLSIWQRVAAAVILALCTGAAFFWFTSPREIQYTTVHAGTRQLKNITLPDQSTVWMNAGCTLRYATDFTAHRTIILEEGEAFFEVIHQAEKPFTVQTSNGMRIEDLGTAFSVKSYQALEEESVGVVSGKVAIHSTAEKPTILNAGEGIVANRQTGRLQVGRYATNAADWVKGHIVLNDVSFRELQLVLQNVYDVQIVFDTPSLENCRITTAFYKTNQVSEILDDLKIVYSIAYTKKENVIHLTGNPCQQ
jgi:transmembrane sensor